MEPTLSDDNKYMITIKTNGDIKCDIITKIPDYLTLKSGLDNGLLEIVPMLNTFLGRDCIAFCDEEGKLKNLPPNKKAQEYWEAAYGRKITVDHLVGPIVIIVGPRSWLARM